MPCIISCTRNNEIKLPTILKYFLTKNYSETINTIQLYDKILNDVFILLDIMFPFTFKNH